MSKLKNIIGLIVIDILMLYIIASIGPLCEKCINDDFCPICISNEQINLSILVLIFNIFYVYGLYNKK